MDEDCNRLRVQESDISTAQEIDIYSDDNVRVLRDDNNDDAFFSCTTTNLPNQHCLCGVVSTGWPLTI